MYAIALGLAPRVVAGAEVYRLEELSRSPIFWLGLQDAGPEGQADVYSRLATEVAPARARRARSVLGQG